MKTTFTRSICIIVTFLLVLLTTTSFSQGITPPLPEESFTVSLYHTGPDSIRNFIDDVITIYDNNYSATVDGDDEPDNPSLAENIAITRDGFYLGRELRPVIGSADTTPLFMDQMNIQNYELEFAGSEFLNPAILATLIDNFTGDRTVLNINGIMSVQFAVTADPASSAPDRFMIVFATPGTLDIVMFTLCASQKTMVNIHGIQVEWVSKTETGLGRYELERSGDGRTFSKKAVRLATGNSGQPMKYNWFDTDPLMANNFYRIKAIDDDGAIKYSCIVKVNIARGITDISLYPNPVTGNNFHLQLNDLAKGTYFISITNNSGQQVFSSQFQHSGGSATRSIELKNKLPTGIYQLQVSGEGIKLVERLNRIND